MTDRIDLDDVESPTSEEEKPNPGDWLWRGEGSPDDEPAAPAYDMDIGADDFGADDAATPRIPRENDDKPVGVPVDSGGAGAAPASDQEAASGGMPPSAYQDDESSSGGDERAGDQPKAAWSEAAANHGADPQDATPGAPSSVDVDPNAAGNTAGGDHSRGAEWEDAQPVQKSSSTPGAASHGSAPTRTVDMTMALSYRAMRRLENVHAALADAENWTDYLGIVGDVDATVINKYQRDNVLDLDFFNGSGTGPAERLAAVGTNSMFYAERMVLVGVDEREQAWAQEADWEFIPLETAADEADWALDDN
ncbi:hypothetical protein Halar_1249 [halophilic archaeon DL31]|jgi:hypothetical protein|nr:hypothetical protein Halar_1249 [halophilic archaeon DL31]